MLIKRLRKNQPPILQCYWQHTVCQASCSLSFTDQYSNSQKKIIWGAINISPGQNAAVFKWSGSRFPSAGCRVKRSGLKVSNEDSSLFLSQSIDRSSDRPIDPSIHLKNSLFSRSLHPPIHPSIRPSARPSIHSLICISLSALLTPSVWNPCVVSGVRAGPLRSQLVIPVAYQADGRRAILTCRKRASKMDHQSIHSDMFGMTPIRNQLYTFETVSHGLCRVDTPWGPQNCLSEYLFPIVSDNFLFKPMFQYPYIFPS